MKMTALLRAEYLLAKERVVKEGESVDWVNTVLNSW